MVDAVFNTHLLFPLLLLFQLESLLNLVVKNTVFFFKGINNKSFSKDLNKGLSLSSLQSFLFFLTFFIVVKGFFSNSPLILNLILISVLLYSLNVHYNLSSNKFLSMHIVFLFLLSYLVLLDLLTSLLDLFILTELYGVLYFFFYAYLTPHSPSSLNLYKTNLALLLWNNFLTSFFMSLSLYLFFYSYNSTQYAEICLFQLNNLIIYLYSIGLFFKLGLPTFHFFKYEVYLYLKDEYIYLFTILTTLVNCNILLHFMSLNGICVCFSTSWFFFFFLVGFFFFVVSNFKCATVVSYFATSSVITISLIFLVNTAL